MTADKLDLAISDSATVDELLIDVPRNERFSWLVQQFGGIDVLFFQDGPLLRHMTVEAVNCFIRGEFMATVLLASSIVERSIAGRLLAIGESKARKDRSIRNILRHASDRQWINEEESEEVATICEKYRNSLAHIRTRTEPERHEVRAQASAVGLLAILEKDARLLITVALRMLGKTSL